MQQSALRESLGKMSRASLDKSVNTKDSSKLDRFKTFLISKVRFSDSPFTSTFSKQKKHFEWQLRVTESLFTLWRKNNDFAELNFE